MTDQIWMGIVGFLVIIIQGLVAYYVRSINEKIKAVCADNKEDHKDIWRRVYGHHHEVECNNNDCGRVKTGNVVVPHEGA